MTKSMEEIIQDGDLTPISKLVLADQEKNQYDKGFVFDRTLDILTEGHILSHVADKRVDLVLERAEFSTYLILHTQYEFRKTVRILRLTAKFIAAFIMKHRPKDKTTTPRSFHNQFQSFTTPNLTGGIERLTSDAVPLRLEYCAMASYIVTKTNPESNFIKLEDIYIQETCHQLQPLGHGFKDLIGDEWNPIS